MEIPVVVIRTITGVGEVEEDQVEDKVATGTRTTIATGTRGVVEEAVTGMTEGVVVTHPVTVGEVVVIVVITM